MPRTSERSSEAPAYRDNDRARGGYYGDNDRARRGYYGDNDRRPYSSPRGGYYGTPRSYGYSRPYLARPYTRFYARPYNYVPYRPYYFGRPYYSFRPRFSIGFGVWLGDTVPYPWAYLGTYRPRVYGYYPGYSVAPSVSLYGGVSFDIQPSDADVFVDGEYVGPVSSFTPYAEPLTLTPGVHRVAVQREGFRAMEWDVTVEPGQVIPFRGDMEQYDDY